MSANPAAVAFLFDVDNTLLDNDRVKSYPDADRTVDTIAEIVDLDLTTLQAQ